MANMKKKPFQMNWMDVMVLGALALGILSATGALNGGTAVSTGTWDFLVTFVENTILKSNWTIFGALCALTAAVWTLMFKGTYTYVPVVLGVLGLALIGPGLVTTAATATLPL